MLDACAMMVVRDGDDFIEPCLLAVLPHVSTVRVALDSRSTDKTFKILHKLYRIYPTLKVSVFPVKEPITDLVEMRNSLLDFDEEWGFILDSDEYHQDIASYTLGKCDSYSLSCYAVWDETRAHKASSKAKIGRFFRNTGKLEWRGIWGKERLFRGNTPLFQETCILPFRYIHFTHIKKDQWRNEMRQLRVADDKHLFPMPPNIINLVKQIREQKNV